ncbi:hemerythrin domain-containing protein [Nonomuraea sp. SYSU D8015]|uniref:hemerythrin domain-containing protein n=1 Tax=Nonomuraea sp. SYSU D8015 TaxID=2593644 RepID=UPI001660BAD3|nr:hemerythrin domain-containing protein [Nonomuraea sp. SYSU D8015]
MAPNLLGFRMTHRAMRGDTRRLARLMNEIAAGEERVDAARLEAIATFATKLCDGIHHHHRAEGTVLWPVVVRSADAEVDLSDLSDDHARLDPLLEEITWYATRLGKVPVAAKRMAVALGALADLLDEHIEEEERLLGQYARPDEMSGLRRLAGPALALLLTLLSRGHRRRQKTIFGAA